MKKLLTCLVLAGLILSLVVTACTESATTPESTQPPAAQYTMRGGTSTLVDAVVTWPSMRFSDIVEAMSDGRIKTEFLPGGQLGKSDELLDMVRTGSLQWCPTQTSYLTKMIPYIGALDLPFLFANSQEVILAYHGPAFDMVNEDLEENGLQPIGWTAMGCREMVCSVRLLTKADDLKDLKWRVPPSEIFLRLWQAWGAKPVTTTWSEVFTGLESGTIEGVGSDAQSILGNKFQEVAKYVTLSGHVYTFIVHECNKEWFDSLPKDLQDMIVEIDEICGEWGTMTVERYRMSSVEELKEQGVQIAVFPQAELDKLKERAKPVFDYARQEYGDEFIDLLLAK